MELYAENTGAMTCTAAGTVPTPKERSRGVVLIAVLPLPVMPDRSLGDPFGSLTQSSRFPPVNDVRAIPHSTTAPLLTLFVYVKSMMSPVATASEVADEVTVVFASHVVPERVIVTA